MRRSEGLDDAQVQRFRRRQKALDFSMGYLPGRFRSGYGSRIRGIAATGELYSSPTAWQGQRKSRMMN
jgi:hypothetical protein